MISFYILDRIDKDNGWFWRYIVKQIKLLNFNKSLQKVNVFFYAYIEISLRSITSWTWPGLQFVVSTAANNEALYSYHMPLYNLYTL